MKIKKDMFIKKLIFFDKFGLIFLLRFKCVKMVHKYLQFCAISLTDKRIKPGNT
jgi:hypothetical protein